MSGVMTSAQIITSVSWCRKRRHRMPVFRIAIAFCAAAVAILVMVAGGKP